MSTRTSGKRKREHAEPDGPSAQLMSEQQGHASQQSANSPNADAVLADVLKQHSYIPRDQSVGPPDQHPHSHYHAQNNAPVAPQPTSSYTMTVPASTESQFLASQAAQSSSGAPGDDTHPESDEHIDGHHENPSHVYDEPPSNDASYPEPGEAAHGDEDERHLSPPRGNHTEASTASGPHHKRNAKETPEAWAQIIRNRKDNHKEVERRRRTTINDGISRLAELIPGDEKNKGKILASAIEFISQLKENEAANIEKWTLEKLLTEQAIAELSKSNDSLRAQNKNLESEVGEWREVGKRNGLSVSVPVPVGSVGSAGNGGGAGRAGSERARSERARSERAASGERRGRDEVGEKS